MADDRDPLEQRLIDRLKAHEARVPYADPPDLSAQVRSRWPYFAAGSAVAAMALVAAVVLPQILTPTAVEPSPPSTPTAALETPSPSVSEAPTPTPAETIAPRANWSVHRVLDGDDPYVSMGGVVEIRGRLFAGGVAGFEQPGIWVSDDGVSWRATAIPRMQPDLVASVKDIIDLGDHLVALAAGGYAEGSGPFVTMIYTSTDGESWQPVDDTPGFDVGAHTQLLQVGTRLVALGRDVWVSSDGGSSWAASATHDELDGDIVNAATSDGLIVAVGAKVASDLVEPPGVVWTSSDGGDSWTRREISPELIPAAVVIGQDGRIVVIGNAAAELVVWTSTDRGETWDETRAPRSGSVYDATVVPGGYAATGAAQSDDAGIVWTSDDAISWTEQIIPIVGTDIDWGPTFGITVAGPPMSVALGPQPLSVASAGVAFTEIAALSADVRIRGIEMTSWAGGLIAIANANYHGEPVLAWSSTDGGTWEPLPFDGISSAMEVTALLPLPDGGLLAVAKDPETDELGVWQSNDGQQWSPDEAALSEARGIQGAAAGPRGLVVLTTSDIWHSGDGHTWNRRYIEPEDQSLTEIAAGPEGFVATGMAGFRTNPPEAISVASADGRDWFTAPVGGPIEESYSLVGINPVGSEWVGIGWNETPRSEPPTPVYRSTDGLDWRAISRINTGTSPYSVHLTGAGNLLVYSAYPQGQAGQAWWSADGVGWLRFPVPQVGAVSSIATASGEAIVAVATPGDGASTISFWLMNSAED